MCLKRGYVEHMRRKQVANHNAVKRRSSFSQNNKDEESEEIKIRVKPGLVCQPEVVLYFVFACK